MAYDFMIQQVNGREVLFHRGSMFQFNAGLYLLPAENVGLYVAYNGAGALEAPALLWQAFMDEYFPGEPVAILTSPPGAAERLAAYRGEYHTARSDFSGAGKFIRLLEAAQVTASRDGYLQLMVEGLTERYVEVEPGLYRRETREEYLAFHTDENGNQWLSLDGRPAFLNFTATSAFRVPVYESLSFGALLILLGLLLLLALLITGSFINHRLQTPREETAYPPPGKMVAVNGHRLHVYAEGEGELTLVFLAGSGTTAPTLDFKALYGRLSDDYRTVVVERAGYGWSDDSAGASRDIETVLQETRLALQAAGESPPYVLLPHSMSGLEALHWANRYPDEVAAIIGLDPEERVRRFSFLKNVFVLRISILLRNLR